MAEFDVENGVLMKYHPECGETKLTVPNGVTSIGDKAFYRCHSLTDIHIPDGVTSIGDEAFYGCTSLTDIRLPDSVTSIGDWAFSFCTSLTDIRIPNGVTSIGGCAFEDCDSLTDICIPDSVTSIGHYAFDDCDSLRRVYAPHLVPTDFGAVIPMLCGFAELDRKGDSRCEAKRRDYIDYIAENKDELFDAALEDADLLRFMLKYIPITPEDYDGLLKKAIERGDAEINAMLLEYRRR